LNYREKGQFLINFAYYLCISVIAFLCVKVLFFYLWPFVFGFIISHFSRKLGKKFCKKIKLPITVLALGIQILLLILLLVLLYLLFATLSQNTLEIIDNISVFLKNAYKVLKNTINPIKSNYPLYSKILSASHKMIDKGINYLSSQIGRFVAEVPGFLIGIVVMVTSALYITADYLRLAKFLKLVINSARYQKLLNIKAVVYKTVKLYLGGYFKIFLLTFFELTAGFWAFKISNPVISALAIALIDILPVFGTGTILIPWSVALLVSDNYKLGIELIVLYIVVTVIRNISEPKIMGERFNINPFFALFFMFVGFKIGGVIGIIVLPIFIIVTADYYKTYVMNK